MYEERIKARFFERKDVSETNKEYVRKFMRSYNGTARTIGKFYSWLPYFLSHTKDAKATMNDKDKIIEIFAKIHSKLRPGGYKTSLGVAQKLCVFLNNGELPEAFKFVKKLTKSEKETMKRINRKDYKNITWEDGLKMAKHTTSMQLKALVLTQLDGGLRPAELEKLDYGSAKKDGKFIILHIRESKTAKKRDVLLYKSAPYLGRWLQLHPTKKENDPLWILEHKDMSSKYRGGNHNLRYKYDAIRQKLRRLGKKAGVAGISLYGMRHSAVTLTKEERMEVEIAAERYGHDINFYINTYGKLSDEQKIERYKAHYGEAKKDEKAEPKNKLCPVCESINLPDKEFCEKCNSPLSLKKALETEKKKDNEIEKLKEQMGSITKKLKFLDKFQEVMRGVK